MTKRQANIENLRRKGANFEQYGEILLFTYDNNGKPCAGYFCKRGAKPYNHYQFRTAQEAADTVQRWKAQEDNDRQTREAAAKKYEAERAQFIPGAILVDCWGCEQTNVDFYRITARAGDMVTIEKLPAKKQYTGDMNGNATPDTTQGTGEILKRKVKKWAHVEPYSFSCARLWDGRPVGFSEWA